MGVVLYVLLCGHLPFGGTGLAENYEVVEDTFLFNKVKANILLGYTDIDDKNLSLPAKNLLTKMLCVDPEQRISSSAIFTHEWMEHSSGEDEDLPTGDTNDDSVGVAGGGSASDEGRSRSKKSAHFNDINVSNTADTQTQLLISSASIHTHSKDSLNHFALIAKCAKDALSKMNGMSHCYYI